MISKNIILNFFIISFLFGIFINNILLNILLSLLVLLFITVLFLNFYIYKKRFIVYFLFIILGYILGILISYYNLLNIEKNEKSLEKYFLNKQNIIAQIDNIYKIKKDAIEYKVKIQKIFSNDISNNDIYAVISIPLNFKLEKGDIIKFESKLYKIENFNNFKYKEFLLTKKIYFKSYIYYLDKIGHKKINLLFKNIYDFRKKILSIIKQIYPKEEAIFLGGILVGAREELGDKLKQDFNNSGLTHLIAVSGFNITILIIFFSYIFKFIPVFFRTTLIIGFIIIFTILVGETAPVIRASIMGIIGYFIMISGRQNNPLSIILLTALIMVIFSPLSLNYDISFHLSFLAVLGIVYTQDFLKKIFYFLPETLAIKEAFILTLASLSFTLPIMIFNFGQISILAPIANILVTWTIPIAMLLGFVSIMVYFVFPIGGVIVGFLTWIFLKYDIAIVHFFGNLDFALLKFDFGIYANYLEVLYFLILVFLIMGRKAKVD